MLVAQGYSICGNDLERQSHTIYIILQQKIKNNEMKKEVKEIQEKVGFNL